MKLVPVTFSSNHNDSTIIIFTNNTKILKYIAESGGGFSGPRSHVTCVINNPIDLSPKFIQTLHKVLIGGFNTKNTYTPDFNEAVTDIFTDMADDMSTGEDYNE